MYEISDGRTIEVEPVGNDRCCAREFAVLMVQADGNVTVKEFHQTYANADAAAASLARGIEFDLRWMAR
jgi:hypothetical protein